MRELLELIIEQNQPKKIDESLPYESRMFIQGYNAGVERVLQDIKKVLEGEKKDV